MSNLVTLQQAKRQLRVTWDDEDDHIQLVLDAAEDAVLNYIKKDFGWTGSNCPPSVKLAILVVLSTYHDSYRDGDNMDANTVAMGYLPQAATSLLHRFRKPAMA